MTDKPSEPNGAFLQWKPVSYTTDKRSMQSTTKMSYYPLVEYNITADNIDYRGLMFAYFGNSETHIRASNVSFGGAGDDLYYNSTAYVSWLVSWIWVGLLSIIKFFWIIVTPQKERAGLLAKPHSQLSYDFLYATIDFVDSLPSADCPSRVICQ